MTTLFEDIIIAAAMDFWVQGRWIWADDNVRRAARTLMALR